ncbi:NAD(P)H-binding protein [Nonomuraea endophytica]|uniref:Uncharacterized protein YbjT (DUF2867 family) n=1 Tax=Nonomuraea endophytica TaxID=714136 RepID=A0A7W7ZW73_9ACTN|nr:NAD(P)H-binding protein [Nonomuraea endophytica]MBB5074908.1 uncharacterized protein YbjT (DUF2867 family) [Nonomuraea endophytica]
MTEILVLGGTGKTGRRVVARLREQGFSPRAASRSGTQRFDWQDETTWEAAVAGVRAAYLVDAQTSDAAERLRAFGELAVAQGVERLVLLSARVWGEFGEGGGLAGEKAVQESGAEWTILRPTWFAQNFSEDPLLSEPVAAGEVSLSTGDGREPFVDLDDVADVAAVALTEPGHAGEIYDLSGPEAITWGEAVAEIARAAGRTIVFRSVDGEEVRRQLVARGYPEAFATGVESLFEHIRLGRGAVLSDGVRRVLGREPGTFRAYAERTAWGTGA